MKLFHFDPNTLRVAAVVIIGFLGLTMIVPALNNVVETWVSKLSAFSGRLPRFARNDVKGNGFSGGFLTGLSLGIVWSPCAGPILAAIATLAATGQVTGSVILVTVVYVTGVGIPLFAFAYGGQRIISKTRFLSRQTGRIQKNFGVIMLLTALAIATGYDQKLLTVFPDYSQIFGLDKNQIVKQQLDTLRSAKQNSQGQQISGLFNTNTPAPEFIGITKWLNPETSLTMQQLRGKVVLIDFWTYTCINCLRTLPHVTSWYDKYHDKGFVVIGVHTPEFQFEHDTNNVLHAIKQYNIHYPVAQDNEYATWNAYSNQYWPAEYLVDAKGNVRRTHFGEGEYDQTELAIQALLKEAGKQIATNLSTMPDTTPRSRLSNETYLGSGRMQFYYPNQTIGNGTQTFTLDKTLPQNNYDLGGTWTINTDNAVAGKNAVLEYNFNASKVFLVLRPGQTIHGKIHVLIDGKVVDEKNAGDDVKNGVVMVDNDRLYNLINLHAASENHLLRLEFQTPGIETYAFTFG